MLKELKLLEGASLDVFKQVVSTPLLTYTVRVIKKDGKPCVVTDDCRADRVNVEIENGIVTVVESIG